MIRAIGQIWRFDVTIVGKTDDIYTIEFQKDNEKKQVPFPKVLFKKLFQELLENKAMSLIKIESIDENITIYDLLHRDYSVVRSGLVLPNEAINKIWGYYTLEIVSGQIWECTGQDVLGGEDPIVKVAVFDAEKDETIQVSVNIPSRFYEKLFIQTPQGFATTRIRIEQSGKFTIRVCSIDEQGEELSNAMYMPRKNFDELISVCTLFSHPERIEDFSI